MVPRNDQNKGSTAWKKNPENKTSNLQYHSKPNCRKTYKEEKSQPSNSESTV